VLDLAAPGIELRYERALRYPMTLMVDREWALQSVAPLNLETGLKNETVDLRGAWLRLAASGTLTAQTACASIAARYVQNAGQIVPSHIVVKTAASCSGPDDAIEDYLVRVIHSAFTFRAIQGQMSLTSNRVGVTLGFSQVGSAPSE
jgi:hypothetical protein